MRYLKFEEELAVLDLKLKEVLASENGEILKEIFELESKIYKKLSPFDILQISRHPDRPHSIDYIEELFDENSYIELHGERTFKDDRSILTYLGEIEGNKTLIIGENKGRDITLKKLHNFGMPHPEGYRKALRTAKMAEKFGIPILMLIDTPGAFPGIEAEERGQSESIARNLFEFSDLKTPLISIVIGEGGSGGALAIGVADKFALLKYSVFSVISPEGCSAILWKNSKNTEKAVTALKMTSKELSENNLIDDIIEENEGGAHRYPKKTLESVKKYFLTQLKELEKIPSEELIEKRYRKLRDIKY